MAKEKPEWLQALEAQSWQAELIASGLAIYGSLTMGPYIDGIAEWAALRFNDRILGILYFLFTYIFAAHAVLVISFIAHLALRILWAGILGLSSVYPNGINMESKTYADHFKKKLKAEFPDLSKYSLELDKLCSMIFSVLCALVLILTAISIWLVIYIILSSIALKYLPVNVFNIIQYSIGGILIFFLLANGLLSQGRFKNSKLAQKFGYKIHRIMSKIMTLMGYKAVNYITQTIRTNINSKAFFVGMFVILFTSMGTSIPRLRKMMPLYRAELFVGLNAHETGADSRNYLDQHTDENMLLPLIQSQIIKESYLQLYIPLYKREQDIMDKDCNTFEWDDDKSDEVNRDLRNQNYQLCAETYYSIYLDNQLMINLNYAYRRDLYNNHAGYQVFMNTDKLLKGPHVLKIITSYTDEKGRKLTRSIPFYMAK